MKLPLTNPVRDLGLELKRRGDELLSLGFRLQAPAWPRQGRAAVDRARRDVEAGLVQFGDRGWLDEPIRFHRAPPRPANARLESRRTGWLSYDELSFASGYRPHRGDPGATRYVRYAANRSSYTWLLRARDPGRPWLVCIHGYGMGSPAIDLYAFGAARLKRKLGINVACLVLPFHGPRAEGNRGSSELISTGVANMLHCHAQAVWDARRLIAWLRGQGAERIGVHGVSLGGNVAALLAGLDAELDSIVAGVPATDFTFSFQQAQRREGEADATIPDENDPLWDAVRQMYRVISPLSLAPVVEPERLALYAGLVDGVVPAAGVRELWGHWGQPRLSWYPGGHLGFLLEPKAQQLVDARMQALAN